MRTIWTVNHAIFIKKNYLNKMSVQSKQFTIAKLTFLNDKRTERCFRQALWIQGPNWDLILALSLQQMQVDANFVSLKEIRTRPAVWSNNRLSLEKYTI